MSDNDIPKSVRDFVFEYIDSVEQLEILQLMQGDAPKSWSSSELTQQLRSNQNSIEKRLSLLISQGLVEKRPQSGDYFLPENAHSEALRELVEYYKIHRYKILELIFSPMKKSRDLAEAFRLSPSKPHKGDSNG